jgi:RNA polymerase sigma-70 factor (ECF subfamily)
MHWQPENYRDFLKLMAHRLCLDRRLKRRFDSSDLVQQSLLKAHQNRDQFEGPDEPKLLRWLHAILLNTARDRLREEQAAKRDLGLEVSLEGAAADSSACLDKWLAADQSSPEQQAQRRELLLAVMRAVEQLPDEQREAVLAYYVADAPHGVIAARMGRTPKAVAMLIYRGLTTLRERLNPQEGAGNDRAAAQRP